MNDQSVVVHHKIQAPMKAEEVKAQVNAIQEVLRGVMKPDVHYGVIPGTKKPTLYKPGSEMLLTTFRISVDPEIEDLSTDDEIRYRVHARGVHMMTGTLVGVGLGEASTNEERYKWRAAAGPKEFAATPEDRRRIKYGWEWGQARGEKIETETQQIRTQPADLANTVLKMAKKRAQVDLCLTALAASDVFEQDLEDMPAELAQGRVNPKAQSKPPQSNNDPDRKASDAQIRLLKAKSDEAGIREVDVWAKADVSDWQQIRFDQVNSLLDWFKEVQG